MKISGLWRSDESYLRIVDRSEMALCRRKQKKSTKEANLFLRLVNTNRFLLVVCWNLLRLSDLVAVATFHFDAVA